MWTIERNRVRVFVSQTYSNSLFSWAKHVSKKKVVHKEEVIYSLISQQNQNCVRNCFGTEDAT